MSTKTHASRLAIRDRIKQTKVTGDGTVSLDHPFELAFQFDDGNGDAQAQDVFYNQYTIGGQLEQVIDLSGGTTDIFGDTLTMATLRQLWVYNRATTSGEILLVGGGPFTTGGALMTTIVTGGGDAGINVYRGGLLLLVNPTDGYALTGGSADKLRIFNLGNESVTFDVLVKGTH